MLLSKIKMLYNVYRDGNAQLRIENGVQVQIPVTATLPVFTSPATANAQENQTAAYMAAATDANGNTLGCSEELTFVFYNFPSFLSGAHICLVIRNLRMNNGAV